MGRSLGEAWGEGRLLATQVDADAIHMWRMLGLAGIMVDGPAAVASAAELVRRSSRRGYRGCIEPAITAGRGGEVLQWRSVDCEC